MQTNIAMQKSNNALSQQNYFLRNIRTTLSRISLKLLLVNINTVAHCVRINRL